MASPPEITITEVLPETLPEDFGQWDNEESSLTQAVRLADSQPGSYGKVAPKKATSRKAASALRARAASEAGRVRFSSLRSGKAERAESKQPRKKWPVIAGAGAVLVLILSAALIPAWHRKEAPAMKVVAAPELAKKVPETIATSTPKPRNAAFQSPLSTLPVPAPDQESAGRPQAHAKAINDKQNAPARIRMAAAPAQHAPPPSSSLAAAAPDGSDRNTAIGSISHGEKQSRLQLASPRVVDLLAGAAFNLLIRRTPPLYPQIAKELGVAGTVVLQVHISKNGTVEDLRVVSGPKMLQQAAVNAVRTWRYRPYRINNQPTEIETNIAVDFSLTD
jgi:periplasmic protein TonB